MMDAKDTLYQSGESVAMTGTYEAVGVDLADVVNKKEKAVQSLQKGDLFPNYEGRAILWRLVQENTSAASTPENS